MPTKRKRPTPPASAKIHAKPTPYEPPSNETPAERLARLLKDAEARGIRPMTEADLDAMGDVWPPEEDLDEFLTWLRKSRREGRY